MKSKKIFAAVLSLVLIVAMTLPGTLALSNGQDSAEGEFTVVNGDASSSQESEEEDQTPAFAELTAEEQYLYLRQLASEDEIEAALATLSEEQFSALMSYAQTVEQNGDEPQTVVFTAAGPFMPPVSVTLARRALMRAAADSEESNGLELSKVALNNGDGTFTIRMEAYTTGKVISTTKAIPVDIVFVLDQSGSMAYDFNGNSTKNNADRRQYAMKQAVNSFIFSVAEKYSEDADHRISIVTFGSGASILQGWTYVDETGKTTLQREISNLPNLPSGATNIAAGMSQAETLMGSGYSYAGTNTQRQKVVVVFTDGVPTTNTDFDIGVANSAIVSAKNLKDAGATVYTVGIFTGADPSQLHGDKFDRWLVDDDPCNGNVGEYWGYTNLNAWVVGGEETIRGLDIAATNRFLNFLSSNFSDATEIGIESYSSGLAGGVAWRITKNFTRAASDYYLTASDSSSLNQIFQTISDQIQTANIDLGSKTVVKDIVSQCFELPQDASEISLYTAAAKSDGTFEEKVAATGVTASVDGNTVTVTGFDYNANFVSDTLKSDNTYGKKLIIEFTVTPKEGFLGGNNVYTNGADSGVYDKDGNSVEAFPRPQVNIPIEDVKVTAEDKNVYLLNDVTAEQLQTGATVKVGDIPLDLSRAGDTEHPYGLEPWQTEYVTITVGIKDAAGNTVSSGLTGLTDDTTYTVSATVSPKYDGAGASGTSATEKSGENTPAAKINVFKPELNFRDDTIYYGEAVPEDLSSCLESLKWKHGATEADTDVMGAAPTLDIVYTPDSSKLADGKVNTKQDIAVDVNVKIGETDVTAHTTFLHTNCTGKTCTVPSGSEFLLHVKTCSLTVTKTGGNANEPYVFTVYRDGVKYSEVTITGSGSETICELPVGTYTIEEDTGWSWRFNGSNGSAVTLSKQDPTGSITATNTLSNPRWLNGFSQVVKNIFGVEH